LPLQTNSNLHPVSQLLVLLSLTGFAITAPILSIFGANLDPFYYYNFRGPGPLILYALIVALVPAFFFWLVMRIAGLMSRKLSTLLYYVVVAVLVGLWVIQLAKWSFGIHQPIALGALALAVAGAFTLVYTRWPQINTLLKIAAIAPLISVCVFLFYSDSSSLMHTAKNAEVDNLRLSVSESDKTYPSVLFIVFDEFSTLSLLDEEGLIDRVRFPNIAALADQATWYRHYTVLSDYTQFSVLAILTGKDPPDLPPSFWTSPKNLFSLFSPTHALVSFEAATSLCGLPQCGVGTPGRRVKRATPQFTRLLSVTASIWLKRNSLRKPEEKRFDALEEETTKKAPGPQLSSDQFLRFIHGENTTQSLAIRPKRVSKFQASFTDHPKALYYLHLLLPHGPWKFYPNGEMYNLPTTRVPFSQDNNDGEAWLSKFSEYRFMMQAQYADSLLGEIFSRMKSLDMWDDLLVVFTADHGRSFHVNTEGRGLEAQNIDSIAYTPLLIKQPFQTVGRADDSNLMSYDLLPTLAEIVDIEIPWSVQGVPAEHASVASRGDQKVFFPGKKISKFSETGISAKLEFSDEENFPEYLSRAIGSGQDSGSSLMLLNGSLGLDRYWGQSPQDFQIRAGGLAVVDELEALENPSPDELPLGAIVGNLEFDPSGDKVLISINGKFVTGSPLISFREVGNTFIAMLPQYALSTQNKIGVYLVEEAGLLELEIH
jgi:hypothetical protein